MRLISFGAELFGEFFAVVEHRVGGERVVKRARLARLAASS
ncbi:hypothetical protein ACIHFD_34345 [Nonomuraea sp. NPDC051941]